MANNNVNSFKESLKVKNYQHSKVKNNGTKKTNAPTPGQKGNVGRTKGGQTR